MKSVLVNGRNSFHRLVRFLFWYAAAVAAIFYFLPMAGLFLQGHYEAMGSAARAVSVAGFFAAVAAWQFASWRQRTG